MVKFSQLRFIIVGGGGGGFIVILIFPIEIEIFLTENTMFTSKKTELQEHILGPSQKITCTENILV